MYGLTAKSSVARLNICQMLMRLEQFKFKLEKLLGYRNMQKKVEKDSPVDTAKLIFF